MTTDSEKHGCDQLLQHSDPEGEMNNFLSWNVSGRWTPSRMYHREQPLREPGSDSLERKGKSMQRISPHQGKEVREQGLFPGVGMTNYHE